MTLECELAELRRQRNTEWEKTKHHLKLAKSRTSLNLQDTDTPAAAEASVV